MQNAEMFVRWYSIPKQCKDYYYIFQYSLLKFSLQREIVDSIDVPFSCTLEADIAIVVRMRYEICINFCSIVLYLLAV